MRKGRKRKQERNVNEGEENKVQEKGNEGDGSKGGMRKKLQGEMRARRKWERWGIGKGTEGGSWKSRREERERKKMEGGEESGRARNK